MCLGKVKSPGKIIEILVKSGNFPRGKKWELCLHVVRLVARGKNSLELKGQLVIGDHFKVKLMVLHLRTDILEQFISALTSNQTIVYKVYLGAEVLLHCKSRYTVLK